MIASTFLRPGLRLAPAGAVLVLAILPAPHARADAPVCRYALSVDTAIDYDTGLTWQRVIDASSYTWANATSYCNNLSLAGPTGWRLPSIQELQTIVDESRANPAIDAAAFPNTPGAYFWSSSPLAGDSSRAWVVNFFHGGVGPNDVGGTYRVRCVR